MNNYRPVGFVTLVSTVLSKELNTLPSYYRSLKCATNFAVSFPSLFSLLHTSARFGGDRVKAGPTIPLGIASFHGGFFTRKPL